jgi:hypothetical protein
LIIKRSFQAHAPTQRSFTSQRSSSSQPQQSNHHNRSSSSRGYFAGTQGYQLDLSNLSRNNIDLNHGLPEYQENFPIPDFNVDDYDFSLDGLPMFLQTENPAMQTSGSGGRGAGNININQNFHQGFTAYQGNLNQQRNPNQPRNPNQSVRGRTGGQRVSLPPLTINEGGRGRSTTRGARNVSRGRGGNNRGKAILVEPEPEEEYDSDGF